MFKKSFYLLCALMLTFSMSACSAPSEYVPTNNIDINSIPGLWQVENQVYSFEPDGQILTPSHNQVSGGSWKVVDDELILTFITTPTSPTYSRTLKFISMENTIMLLENTEGSRSEWRKVTRNIQAIEGELFFRERLALPPEIFIGIELTQNNGTTFVTNSLTPVASNLPIPFKIYYSERNIDTSKPLELNATIYSSEGELFTTPEAIIIEQGTSVLTEPVLLIHSVAEIEAPQKLTAPLAYTFTQELRGQKIIANLYLEKNNFFMINQEIENIEDKTKELFTNWGIWNQVDRDHNIEFIMAGKEPIKANIHNEQLKFNSLPYNKIKLSHSMLFNPTEISKKAITVNIAGSVELKGRIYNFTPYGVNKAYTLRDTTNILKDALAKINSTNAHIEIKALYIDNVFTITALEKIDTKNLYSTPATSHQELTSLENTYWRLLSLNGKELFKEVESELSLKLNHEEGTKRGGQGGGSDGCNNFTLNWEVPADSNNVLSLMLGGSTMKMCHGEELNTQSREYMQTLDGVNGFAIEGSVLELKKDNDTVLRFEAVAL